MAEVFGAVASGAGLVSLALQLADSALKIKSFCHDVKKAPQSLLRLGNELNTLSVSISGVGKLCSTVHIPDYLFVSQAIDHTRERAEEIVALAKRLEGLNARNTATGRVYTAYKLRSIRDLCDELESSKLALVLALQSVSLHYQAQMYNDPFKRNQGSKSQVYYSKQNAVHSQSEASSPRHSIISAKLHKTSCTRRNQLNSDLQPIQSRLQYRISTILGFELPSWFTRYFYGFSLRVQLRCYTRIPVDSEVFLHCDRKDVSAVEYMFRMGTASPYDMASGLMRIVPKDKKVDYWWSNTTMTPFTRAVISGCNELRNMILSYIRPADRMFAVQEAFRGFCVEGGSSNLGTQEMMHYFLEDLDVDLNEFLDPSEWWHQDEAWQNVFMRCTVGLLSLMIQKLGLTWSSWEETRRFDFLCYMHEINPRVLLQHCGPVEKLACLSSSVEGNALHLIARHFGTATRLRSRTRCTSTLDTLRYEGWISFLADCVQARIALHAIADYGLTAFQLLMTWLQPASSSKEDLDEALHLLGLWFRTIARSGCDVFSYLERERNIATSECKKLILYWRGAEISPVLDERLSTDPRALTYKVQIVLNLYQLYDTPGSWHDRTCLPMTICWPPSQLDHDYGPSQVIGSTTLDIENPELLYCHVKDKGSRKDWIEEVRDDSQMWVRPKKNRSQDIGVRRRAASEPRRTRSYHTAKELYPDLFSDDSSEHRTVCTLCKRLLWHSGQRHCGDKYAYYNGERFHESREQIGECVRALKDFKARHRKWPVQCGMVGLGDKFDDVLTNGTPRTLSLDTVWDMDGDLNCDDFPNCVHQNVHLGQEMT